LLDPSFISQVPSSTIILNTEQIYSDTGAWNQAVFPWAKQFQLWDYSPRNIEKFKELGIDGAKLFKIGYQKELVRLNSSQSKDIDVLFYGSVNERRKTILDGLEAKGLKVKVLFGVYGKDRDDWIERSKIVLNHHYYEAQIFEIIRVFYLLTNSIAVVGEVNQTTSIDLMCKEGISPAKYEDLVSKCVELVQNDALRESLQLQAFQSIKRFPQSLFTKAVLESKP
jgi:predicted NACHT family NTPase